MRTLESDILVIGSGIAGLSFALKAAEHGTVALVTKKERAASSTNWAQGGIAAVVAPDDSIALHVRDTVTAGAGLCHTRAVHDLVHEGPARVRELMAWGVEFTREADTLSLGREGGHSRRRIVHAGDLTGREIERALLAAVAQHAAIRMFEDHVAVDLLTGLEPRTRRRRCTGALVYDHRARERIVFLAPFVLLASGGLGQAYQHTTNPDIATGDGVAMAYRAGAAVANLEFVQFHPTALHPADERAFLISEAVRGEGAVLRRLSGEPLMAGVHPLGSLAPRDVVARTIDLALKESGEPYVLLDLSPIPKHRIEQRFPGILAECATRGIDIRTEPVPVVPAAHYACGGVRTDSCARTTLPGLFAAGEVACTGVHGANRLASNSLLEAVVYSHRAVEQVPRALAAGRADAGWIELDADPRLREAAGEPVTEEQIANWMCQRDELRRITWNDAGIVRSTARLHHAEAALDVLRARVDQDYARGALDTSLIELRNLAEAARLIVASALSRRESRGLHFNLDYPFRDNELHLRDTILVSHEA
jgi:L-aspartate oxidase